MIYSPTIQRVSDALDRAQQHWAARRRQTAASSHQTTGVTVTLTRQAGAPGTSVAHALGERLGWPVYDHELLEQISQETGLRLRLLESVDERRRNWLEESVEAFSNVPMISEGTYLKHLLRTILSLGAHGQCIIVGRGAAFVLPPETTLRARLVADRKDRIENFAQRFSLTHAVAVERVAETERERLRFVRESFQKDAGDPLMYDLVLNASRWSVAECAQLLEESVHAFDRRLQALNA